MLPMISNDLQATATWMSWKMSVDDEVLFGSFLFDEDDVESRLRQRTCKEEEEQSNSFR